MAKPDLPSGADPRSVALPKIELKVVADCSPADSGGFLLLKRRRMVAVYEDGSKSREFVYDSVDRHALDAVVLCAHFVRGGERYVYLRSALRPPVTLRDPRRSPTAEGLVGLWELPAGLVEPTETGADGIVQCGARELEEELGFQIEPGLLNALGPSTFPCPGVIGERHFFLEVEVDPGQRREPSLDGSPLEAHGVVVATPLSEALAMCRDGRLQDSKTELALRRLAEAIA